MTSSNPYLTASPGPARDRETLVDLLERVLDKGVVIAGDVSISLLDIELLTLRIRLLIASADKAQEMGIDWWKNDPFLSGRARAEHEQTRRLEQENQSLRERLADLESKVSRLVQAPTAGPSVGDSEWISDGNG